MKASSFLIKFFNFKSEDQLLAFISDSNYEEFPLPLIPLTLLPCLRNKQNQQLYFERFLQPKPNDTIHDIIAECFPRAEDGTIQWEHHLFIMLDDLQVGECECNQKATHNLVYGDDKENLL